VPDWGGQVWHPIDLPEGYHTASQGQSLNDANTDSAEGCPWDAVWSGCTRSTGCHTSLSVQDRPVTRRYVEEPGQDKRHQEARSSCDSANDVVTPPRTTSAMRSRVMAHRSCCPRDVTEGQ
jgi:hypothetical protein